MHNFNHTSVLLKESIAALNIAHKPDGIYIDGTFGRGGHSKEILKNLDLSAKLLVIDQDHEAIEHANNLSKSDQYNRLIVCHGRFDKLDIFLQTNNINKVDGILLDLGVSSPQFDDYKRGFSFNNDGPLDMRMDISNNNLSASNWINSASTQEIADILYKYGDEKYSRRIAKFIVEHREHTKITSTKQLAEIIKVAHPKWPKNIHPATKSFMAIRLFINKELEALDNLLNYIINQDILNIGSRIVIISFHSLEDRIVKNYFNKYSKYINIKLSDNIDNKILKKLPIQTNNSDYIKPKLKIVQKALKAANMEQEVKSNIRARSAIMRVAEKI